jgi:hypothetical protein
MTINARHGLIGVALVGLLVAYIPQGPLLMYWGFEVSWGVLTMNVDWLSNLYYFLLLIATVLGNVAIVCCLASMIWRLYWLPMRTIKIVGIISQLLWAPLGYEIYPWYFWVGSSALLFALIPSKKSRPL